MNIPDLMPSTEPVESAYVLYVALLDMCDEHHRVDKETIAGLHKKWEDEFAFLSSRQYITFERRSAREKFGAIRISRLKWMEKPSPTKEAAPLAAHHSPYYARFAFIDFPNFLNRPSEADPTRMIISAGRIAWGRFAKLIENKLAHADSSRFIAYFPGRYRNYFGRVSTKQIEHAGFELRILSDSAKGVDPDMIVDMMDVDFNAFPKGSVITYLIGSGDRDFIPAIQRKMLHAERAGVEFHIVILSWKNSFSPQLLKLPNLTIVSIDDYLELIDPIGAIREKNSSVRTVEPN